MKDLMGRDRCLLLNRSTVVDLVARLTIARKTLVCVRWVDCTRMLLDAQLTHELNATSYELVISPRRPQFSVSSKCLSLEGERSILEGKYSE